VTGSSAPLPRQDQARALGDPTRYEIYRYVATAGREVDVAELTAHMSLNHNAIRQHLAKLAAAGLVTEGRQLRDQPGRPRLVYRADPPGEGLDGYERLAVWLTEVVAAGTSPEEVGRRAGARLAEAASRSDTSPLAALEHVMAAEGFSPSVRRRDGRTTLVLGRCPYSAAVLADQSTICSLHLGLARGAAEVIGGITVDDLAAHDPRRAGCRLVVTELPDR
jgi:predicted ArsR family transcriptional regulator